MQSRKGFRAPPSFKVVDTNIKKFQIAIALHQQGKISAAKTIYEEILTNNPNDFDALHLSGVIFYQSGMFDESEAFFAKAVRINSKSSSLHSNRGNNLKELKRFDEALASYDKAISIKPDLPEALYNRGNTLKELKRFDEALDSYDKAILIKPDYAEAFNNRGVTLDELKRLYEALASYENAISINSNYADAFNNRGNVFEELKRFDEALSSYDKAISIKPDYAEALNNRGNTLEELKRFEEALDSFDKAILIKKDFPEALYNRGNILKKLKRFDESLASYDKAVSIKSDYAEALNNRGITLEELKRFDEALDSYDKAISIKSDYAEALNNRGNTLEKLKRFDEAVDSYDQAISIKSDFPEALYSRGNTLKELKRFDESLASYDQAISIKSDYAEVFNNRGNILNELKRFDESLASYDQAISIKPDFPEALNNRGKTLQELKRFDEALDSYEKAISIKTDYAEAKLGKSLNLLLTGDLFEGWRHYEYRLKCPHFIENSLGSTDNFLSKITTVNSVTDLTGKHLVLITEQGVGDVVMFASMVQDILSFVRGLDFVVDERLIEIFKLSFPSSRVFSSTNYNENDAPTDAVYMFIGSLGRLLRNKISDFPRTPYLVAEFDKIKSWRNRLQCENKELIGISWKGGTLQTRDWARSFSLQNFLKMIPQDNFRFVNIQHKSSLVEVQQAVETLNVDIISFPETETSDIADLSALLCSLDHVVTVQNSNIHLCGSLGVPCVGIIPEVPEWRYGTQRDHMIWYEKVKLIRTHQETKFQEVKTLISSYISRKI